MAVNRAVLANDLRKLSLIGKNLTNEYYLSYAADRTRGAGVPGAVGEQRGVLSRGREILYRRQSNSDTMIKSAIMPKTEKCT